MKRRDHAAEMAALQKQFNDGRKRAVLDALYVSVCAYPEKPVPTWAKRALAKALHDIAMARAASWDDVFGMPHPRRKIAQIRRQREIQWSVFKRVIELRRQNPKPRKIFETVAREFKTNRATVKRCFDHVAKMVQ